MPQLPFYAPLLIDDAKLRRQAAAAAEKLLRRLDRLTQAAEGFYGVDQRLFQDWFQLTFRAELARQESLKNEREKLAREREAVAAYATFAKVSLEDAYDFLEQEKLRYELGSPEEKARIEEARRYRQRQGRGGKKEARAEAREKRKAKADAAAMKDWWSWFAGLDRAAIQALSAEPEYSSEALLAGLLAGDENWQREAGVRFWDETSPYVRKLASRRYFEHRGEDLEDLVRAFRTPRHESSGAADPSGVEPRPLRPEEENLKLLYRKFVRYLHPDARGPGAALDSWQKKMWHDGQEAYQSGNYPALHALYRVVMLRLGKLGELTMGEIRAIAAGLEKEFRDLQRDTKGMRNAPFWKFSKRKDYFDLTRKFRLGFVAELARLEEEVTKLRQEARDWALISAGRRGRPERSRGMKQNGKRRR